MSVKLMRVEDLPFSHLDVPWVDVSALERGEEQLTRRSVVRMGPSEEHRYVQACEHLQCCGCGVIWGIVKHDHSL